MFTLNKMLINLSIKFIEAILKLIQGSFIIFCYFFQLDCGIHPGLSGMDALPYTDMIESDEIDLLLITQ